MNKTHHAARRFPPAVDGVWDRLKTEMSPFLCENVMPGFCERLFTRTAARSRRAAIKLIPKAGVQTGNLYLLVYFSSAVCPSDLPVGCGANKHDKDT